MFSRQQALEKYNDILTTPFLDERDFMVQIVNLIDKSPTFIPAYLETLERLEGIGSVRRYREFLSVTYNNLREPIFELSRNELLPEADFAEICSLYLILYRLQHIADSDFKNACKRISFPDMRKIIPRHPHTYLERLRSDINTVDVEHEIRNRRWLWYSTFPKTYHHKWQDFIILRAPEGGIFEKETPETEYTNYNTRDDDAFSEMLTFLSSFAEEHDSILGIVRLFGIRPHGMVYRHCDDKTWHSRGSRFHLVISAGKMNLVNVGSEYAFPRKGEIWRYDNRVQHKSYNLDDEERIHLIFDLHKRRDTTV